MNDRLVLVRVTDPDIDELYVEQWGGKHVDGSSPDGYTIYVPEDDELREDLDLITRWVLGDFDRADQNAMDLLSYVAAGRLRAAAGLDPEGEHA